MRTQSRNKQTDWSAGKPTGEQVAIGFSYAFHWLREWRELLWFVVKQDQKHPWITFDWPDWKSLNGSHKGKKIARSEKSRVWSSRHWFQLCIYSRGTDQYTHRVVYFSILSLEASLLAPDPSKPLTGLLCSHAGEQTPPYGEITDSVTKQTLLYCQPLFLCHSKKWTKVINKGNIS